MSGERERSFTRQAAAFEDPRLTVVALDATRAMREQGRGPVTTHHRSW